MTGEITKIKLEDLGYDEFFDSKRKFLGLTNFPIARVVAEYKGLYRVKNLEGEYLAKITGKQMFKAIKRADYPAVGDWVAITKLNEERAVIRAILPRKTIIQKKYSDKQDMQIIATNIDIAFIVESLDRDFNLNRFERYFVLANKGGVKPIIILNKVDLISKSELNQKIEQIKNRFENIDIISTSVITGEGFNELINHINRGKTYCFLGSSGVGKSSLINKLLRKNIIKTREISDFTGRGKHTTTTREMYFLKNGGIVIDNPGTREVGVADAVSGIENIFDEIIDLSRKCKYADCAHERESGCAVLKAVESGELNEAKYRNYIKLKKENEFYETTNYEKKEKDRKFGKFVKQAKKQLKEIKP